MKKFTEAIGKFLDKSERYVDAVSISMNPNQVKLDYYIKVWH